MLQELFAKFGYYQEGAKSVVLPGKEGADKIKAMMDTLRSNPPKTLGGIGVQAVADLMTGDKTELASGKTTKAYDLPPANVVMFFLEDGTKAIARPSGTEPKIKFYILTREPGDDLAKAQASATARIQAIIDDFTGMA
jgi:phosphoglucomutase